MPGQIVSVDQFILRATGRIYHTKVKADQSDMFLVGCVFIDHASGYVSIKHQVAINATETVKAKLTFEREAQSREWLSRDTTLIMGSSIPQSLWRSC